MINMLLRTAIIFLLFNTAACSQAETESSEAEGNRVVSVEIAAADKGDLTLERTVYGRTAANVSTPIVLQTPGQLETLAVKTGDHVAEKDEIATLATAVGKQTIRAPEAGEIVRLTASEGEMVSNEEPLALVADLRTLKLNFTVTAAIRELFSLDKNYTASINGTNYQATITAIDKMPNETGLYPVTATVENPDGTILPGMVAELAVSEQQIKRAVLVPTASVVEENNETFVYAVKDNKAVKQAVTVLATQTKLTAIEGDVQAGDKIVVTGQLTLSDGVQVNVVKGE